jgi:hypothetical protein
MFSRPVSSSSTVATCPGEAHAAPHLVGLATDVESGHARGAAGGLRQRRHHPHRRGLAGAVGTEQAEHRAWRHGEANAVDRWSVEGGVAEPLHQVDGFDGW